MDNLPDQINEKLRFILGRRSIRVCAPGAIAESQITQLLQAAMSAPSAVGCDPWRFVVVRQREKLTALAQVLTYGKMLNTAPLAFIVCGDLEAAHDRQLSYLLQDCSAAIENLLLAAHALGLGACWLGVHPRAERIQQIKELFSLPPTVVPVSAIAVCHPGETKEPRTRFNRDYVHWETW